MINCIHGMIMMKMMIIIVIVIGIIFLRLIGVVIVLNVYCCHE